VGDIEEGPYKDYVLKVLSESKKKNLDPMTILALIGLVKTLIDLYIQCKKNDWHLFEDAKAMQAGKILTYFKRRRLRNEIAKIINNEDEQQELYDNFLKITVENRPMIARMFLAEGVK
jgi:hypothetical protein